MFGIKTQKQLIKEANEYTDKIFGIADHFVGGMHSFADAEKAMIFGSICLQFICRESVDFTRIAPYLPEILCERVKYPQAHRQELADVMNATWTTFEQSELEARKRGENPLRALPKYKLAKALSDLLDRSPDYLDIWYQTVMLAVGQLELKSYYGFASRMTERPDYSTLDEYELTVYEMEDDFGKMQSYSLQDVIPYEGHAFSCLHTRYDRDLKIGVITTDEDGSVSFAQADPDTADAVRMIFKEKHPNFGFIRERRR